MGPEDSNNLGQLYLTTKDGYTVPMTATTLCIPDLISVDLSEEDDKQDDRAFRLRDSYSTSFTIEPTDETVKKLYRFFRATRRWSRKKRTAKETKISKGEEVWHITRGSLNLLKQFNGQAITFRKLLIL